MISIINSKLRLFPGLKRKKIQVFSVVSDCWTPPYNMFKNRKEKRRKNSSTINTLFSRWIQLDGVQQNHTEVAFIGALTPAAKICTQYAWDFCPALRFVSDLCSSAFRNIGKILLWMWKWAGLTPAWTWRLTCAVLWRSWWSRIQRGHLSSQPSLRKALRGSHSDYGHSYTWSWQWTQAPTRFMGRCYDSTTVKMSRSTPLSTLPLKVCLYVCMHV